MTPLMQQYHTIKQQYPDALVLFQVGDFYELFYEDAQQAALFLGITLTSRGKVQGVPIPLCGVPCHTVDHYIVKLVQGGFRVVICNQQGEAVPGKLVDRVIAQIITPGTLTDEHLLNPTKSSLLVAIATSGASLALLYVEMITGICRATVIDLEQRYLIEAELARLAPQEIIRDAAHHDPKLDTILHAYAALVQRTNIVLPTDEAYTQWCSTHIMLNEQQMLQTSSALSCAVRILYTYLYVHGNHALVHLRPLELYSPDEALIIDAVSQRNLSIAEDPHDAKSNHTLVATLDHAATAMGSRIIRRWLLRPLRHMYLLQQRLDSVDTLVRQTVVREDLFALLRNIGDYERIVGRIVLDRAPVRDYRLLCDALPFIIRCGELLHATLLAAHIPLLRASQNDLVALHAYLMSAVHATDPADWLIKEGFDEQLDTMRQLSAQGEQALFALEEQERRATCISSLKIKYISMYGYMFEITRTHRSQVPAHYELVHSLSNHDRFTTPELRTRAAEIEYARKHAVTREREIFAAVTHHVRQYAGMLRAVADELATLDGLLSFAIAAVRNNYVRPHITEEREFFLRRGRHPIVEGALARKGATFIANDMHLNANERIWLITGPNMGGKSTFLRQAALALLMAHAGSFVAAQEAIIPRSDRLFTRIGASDNVPQGKSTFFVEMEEVALICTASTERSFVIIDELGRGTGTRDGLALARAIIEYLDEKVQLLGLCATHYHTLASQLGAGRSLGVYHAASNVTTNGVVLLHTIKKGNATGSFGLEVARSAGLPQAIVARARHFEHAPLQQEEVCVPVVQPQPVVLACRCAALCKLDLDALSPRQAYQLIASLQESSESTRLHTTSQHGQVADSDSI